MPKILFPLPDRDFDVTEVSVPWRLFTRAGHTVVFATETGAAVACDPLLLTGVVLGQLGADSEPRAFYAEMIASWSLTAWKLGDYYRTYPEAVEDEVRRLGGLVEVGPITLISRGTERDDSIHQRSWWRMATASARGGLGMPTCWRRS